MSCAFEQTDRSRLRLYPEFGSYDQKTVYSIIDNAPTVHVRANYQDDPASFKSGRAFSAWIGLVPKQHSSGGRDKLGHVTKKGNPQLSRLLVAGAMWIIIRAKRDGFTRHPWLVRPLERKPTKIGRMIWALLMKGGTFNPELLQPV